MKELETQIEALKLENRYLKEQVDFLLLRIKWIRDSSREQFSWDRDRKPTTEILTKILKDMGK